MTLPLCLYCGQREPAYRFRDSRLTCCAQCYPDRPVGVQRRMQPIVFGERDRRFVAFAVVLASLCLWVIGLILVAVMR